MSRLRPVLAIVLALIALVGLASWGWRAATAAPVSASEPTATGRALVVYYLHGTFRCVTCNAIEVATQRAVASWKPPAGATRPEMLVRNFLLPENDEFETRFKVTGSSVLVAEVVEGKIQRGEVLFDVGAVPPDPETAVRQGLDRFTAGTMAPEPKPRRHYVLAWLEDKIGLSGRWLAMAGALALGLVTAIMPCPLATNVAAMSFLARKGGKVRSALLSGFAYALGRTVAYVGLGTLLGAGLLQIPAVNRFLSVHLNAVLGPLLILVAIPLLHLWSPSWTLFSGERAKKLGERGGWLAAFSLGIIFALAFCPTSAALFLGGLMPLVVFHQQPVLLSLLYGLGTAAPVVIFAVLLAVAAEAAGRAFQRITAVEPVFRIITGLVFLGVGLWYVVVVLTSPH